MYHVAILKKKYFDLILRKEKTVESRWYRNNIDPWHNIMEDDTVFLKESGSEYVTAQSLVEKVLFEDLMNKGSGLALIRQYGEKIKIAEKEYFELGYDKKRYCILTFLKDVQMLDEPFKLNRQGLGSGTAWITAKEMDELIYGKKKTQNNQMQINYQFLPPL